MKNLIFITVFFKNEYIDLLMMLLETLYKKGNLGDNTDILIYTTTKFKEIILEKLNENKLLFKTNDSINNVDSACKARLDFFDFGLTEYYKILYLDTDILVVNDINKIFNLLTDEKLYAVKEGSIDHNREYDYWGKFLFGDTIDDYSDKSAFNSGVLLFPNTKTIMRLFKSIKECMVLNNNEGFTDQVYFVYNTKKYNLLQNNSLLNVYVSFNNVSNNSILVHFIGGPGEAQSKLAKMTQFLNYFKLNW
jgi:lipopolysaccharide biosynthesis glycosyltransferase